MTNEQLWQLFIVMTEMSRHRSREWAIDVGQQLVKSYEDRADCECPK